MGRTRIICGAGVVGKALLGVLNDAGLPVHGFTDYSSSIKMFCDPPVYRIEDAPADALFIISVLSIENVVRQLEKREWIPGGPLLYGFDVKQDNESHLIDEVKYQVESCRIAHAAYMERECFVRSIDIMITERCSLRCRDCSNLMQYFKNPVNFNMNNVITDTEFFLSNVDGVLEARILGGDAFMHPKWAQIVGCLIEQPKVHRIVIYTNGIIIPKNLDVLANDKVIVYVTDYGPLSKNISAVLSLFRDNGIWHRIFAVDTWIDCSSVKKHGRTQQENDQLFQSCIANNLTTMVDGRAFRCPFAASAYLLHVAEDGCMELGAGRQAMFAYLHSGKAMAACDYCTSRVLTKTIPPAIQIKKGA